MPVCAAVVALADGRSLWMAWPRLIGLVVVGVPVATEPGKVAGGVVGVPSIVAFRSLNGMWRFCETCSAARNWP